MVSIFSLSGLCKFNGDNMVLTSLNFRKTRKNWNSDREYCGDTWWICNTLTVQRSGYNLLLLTTDHSHRQSPMMTLATGNIQGQVFMGTQVLRIDGTHTKMVGGSSSSNTTGWKSLHGLCRSDHMNPEVNFDDSLARSTSPLLNSHQESAKVQEDKRMTWLRDQDI